MEKIKRNGWHTTAQRNESTGRIGGTQTSWKALAKEITFYVFSGRVSASIGRPDRARIDFNAGSECYMITTACVDKNITPGFVYHT